MSNRKFYAFILLFLCALCLAGFPGAAGADQVTGTVTKVSDGDTFHLMTARGDLKVRLSGVDCPEKKQPYGQDAKAFTRQWIMGKVVTVAYTGLDQYGRAVGVVSMPDGRVLNTALVQAGLAWCYRQYCRHCNDLIRMEQDARRAGLGLWADSNPVPPWEYRKARR